MKFALFTIALLLFSCSEPAYAESLFQRMVRNAAVPGEWHAERYAKGSSTGGLAEAFEACREGGGGTVRFRRVSIDATGMQSPILSTPVVYSGRKHKSNSPCALVGYGSDGSINYVSSNLEKELTGAISVITIHDACEMLPNDAGEKIGLAIAGSGQRLADFNLHVGCLDDQTRGVVTQGGTASIAELSFDRVVCAGDVTIGLSPRGSICLDFQATMRSHVLQGTYRNFGTGIEFGNTPADHALKNNSNILTNVSMRSNYVGLALRTWHACSELTGDELIVESNERGMMVEDMAACRVLLNGGHFEQVYPTGISNIEVHAPATRIMMQNTYLGGTPSYEVNAEGRLVPTDGSWDYYRTVQSTGFGLDVFTGVSIQNGINSPGAFVQLIEPMYVRRARGLVGAGDSVWHPKNCERHLRITGNSTNGRECGQLDDGSTWRAKPLRGVGREGVADLPGEVVCVAGCI